MTRHDMTRLIEWITADSMPITYDQLIDELAEFGEPVVIPLLHCIRAASHQRRRHSVALRVFERIGYPANKAALEYIVCSATIIDFVEWQRAVSIVRTIGAPAVPEIRTLIHSYLRDCNEYKFEIQGLGILLETLDLRMIEPLMPELLDILSCGTDDNFVDEYVLPVLGGIGSPAADLALPWVENTISSSRSERIRFKCLEILHRFDKMSVRNLTPVLKACLCDSSDAIRRSAARVLDLLHNDEPRS